MLIFLVTHFYFIKYATMIFRKLLLNHHGISQLMFEKQWFFFSTLDTLNIIDRESNQCLKMCKIFVGQGWWWKKLNYTCVLCGKVKFPQNTRDGVLVKMRANRFESNIWGNFNSKIDEAANWPDRKRGESHPESQVWSREQYSFG